MAYDWLNMFTIKKQAAGSTCHFFAKMSEKALRTTRKRESRARQKERHHHYAFIAEYTERKYTHIYEEADNFYKKLFKRYPTKTRLTTCPEFKAWELEIRKNQAQTTTQMASTNRSSEDPTTTTQMASTNRSSEETTTTPIDLSSTDNMQINIQLMDSTEVQETRDTLMFQDIYPSLMQEINPETLQQIIREIQESDVNRDIFNYTESDEDINDILNTEINNSMNELSALEEELLMY